MSKYFTKEGLAKLKEELDYLKNTKRKEIAARLKHAISFGDLKENAAYEEAKEAQGFLEGRISELADLINSAVLIEECGENKRDKVRIGCKVTFGEVVGKKTEKEETFRIVDSTEANPLEEKISLTSPLGAKLMNRKKGEIFDFPGPEGKIKYKIINIE